MLNAQIRTNEKRAHPKLRLVKPKLNGEEKRLSGTEASDVDAFVRRCFDSGLQDLRKLDETSADVNEVRDRVTEPRSAEVEPGWFLPTGTRRYAYWEEGGQRHLLFSEYRPGSRRLDLIAIDDTQVDSPLQRVMIHEDRNGGGQTVSGGWLCSDNAGGLTKGTLTQEAATSLLARLKEYENHEDDPGVSPSEFFLAP